MSMGVALKVGSVVVWLFVVIITVAPSHEEVRAVICWRFGRHHGGGRGVGCGSWCGRGRLCGRILCRPVPRRGHGRAVHGR